uniref:RAS protein activator like 3 n=1 Tax=Sphenodon punctatus TaxID=8508 RepID=A0A8D0G011_SPHPU
ACTLWGDPHAAVSSPPNTHTACSLCVGQYPPCVPHALSARVPSSGVSRQALIAPLLQVVSTGGRRCFGCASAAERDRWIENLRRAAQPSKDNCERVEHALSLWVYEGRDLPLRRRFLCELHLDGVLYARTTAKQADPSGTLFWGERFDLETLPPAQELRVSLRREGSSLGSVAIPLTELAAARQALERWYPVCRERPGAPALRLRGRYRCTRVLPIVQYKEFAEYLTFHYRELCARLEHATSAREKEEMASALVRVLQSTGKAKFLIDLGVAELDRFGEREALIFRENTLATKAIDEYMKLVGGPYLLATLGEAIARLYASEDCCEVDPGKCSACDLSDNQNNLRQNCEEVFQRITASGHCFPAELNEIFAAWQEECDARGKEALGQRLISASLFLRFLCPAIMSPSLFGLTQEYPGDATSRTLTLMAKVIQNLANLAAFGEKEAYMNFMNGFLEQNWEGMRSFLGSVASPEGALHLEAYDGSIDLALELSGLHALLCDIIAALDQVPASCCPPLAEMQGGTHPWHLLPFCLCSREAEKPGFVPPRELSKHTPLIKSHSMTNIQKGRGREPEPLPSTPPAQARTLVQRTQSVPAQSKGARRLLKQGSMDCQPPEAGSLSAESQEGSQRGSTPHPPQVLGPA